jgi:hypothetical protein
MCQASKKWDEILYRYNSNNRMMMMMMMLLLTMAPKGEQETL